MGQVLKTPEYGIDCAACTPGTWAAGKTPLKMLLFFTGITECPLAPGPAPPEGTYVVEQVIGTPCLWRDAPITTIYRASPGGTSLQYVIGAGWYFSGSPVAICQDFSNNDLVACGGPATWGIGGTCQCSMESIDEIPWKLTDDYNLMPTDEGFFNQWLLDTPYPPDKVIGLYSTKYRVNVLVKYES